MHQRVCLHWFISSILIGALAGCTGQIAPTPDETGDSGGGEGNSGGQVVDMRDGLVAIAVTPEDTTVVIDGAVPATVDYRATGTYEDGTQRDITQHVGFQLDEIGLGTFADATLTTGTRRGGRTQVRAILGRISGSTGLTVVTRQRLRDASAPDLPAAPDVLFNGPAAERHPEIVYPLDGVLIPPNVRALELHFYPGQDNTLFELGFTSDTVDIKVYTRCVVPLAGGCIYTPDDQVWMALAESNRGLDAVRITVRGTDDAGSGVGTATSVSMSVAHDDLEGAIYYWTTSQVGDGRTAIMRYDFAAATQTEAERFVDTEMTDGKCIGCHALSRSGDKLIAAADSSYNAHVLLLDVSTELPLVPFGSPPRSAFSAWNPDGSRYVGVFADEKDSDGFISYDLNIFSGDSGAWEETIAVGGTEDNPSTHPDWSPDGDSIVYTHVGYVKDKRKSNGTLAFADQGSLRMVNRTDNGRWSSPVVLTESIPGQSTYYPSFSPTGELLVFNRSVCASGQPGSDCDCYDDPGAALYVMAPKSESEAVELARANTPGPTDQDIVQSSYPKWSPFTFRRTGDFASRLHWLTFSSSRNYGLRQPPSTDQGESYSLIWMVGVDPDAALRGEDPSFAPLALPVQNLTTDNHTAQWTEQVVIIK